MLLKMEEKTDRIITCKNVKDKDNGNQSLKNDIKDVDLEKKESETKNTEPKLNKNTENKKNNGTVKNNSNKVLKRKITEDGVVIERVLSEGEASSGFETVSSIDSKVDIDDLELSSSIEDNDEEFNIIVKVKNELAFQNKNRSDEKQPLNETRSKRSSWDNHKSDSFSKDYSNRRTNGIGNSRESKYRQRNNVDKNYNYNRRNRESSERKNFDNSRQRTYNKDRSAYRDQDRRSRRERWDDYEIRFRRSRSNERSTRFRNSRTPDRIVRNRSPSHKNSRTNFRRSKSFDRNSSKSSPERSSPSRKKRRSSPRNSSSSIWKRLDNRRSPDRVKKDEINSDKKNSKNSFETDRFSPHRKKERTPFIIELERKLKEVERTKIIKQEPTGSTDSTMAPGNELSVMPTLPEAATQSCPPVTLTYMTSVPYFQGAGYPMTYTPMPAVSVNNLPLVPGPTGLPVHIMATGEQIPHDIDGRPIPVGPNGYYLPLDPTGRLFPHIVSPGNQAVPIHLSDDGVLRLPNSEPVPFGPEHQLPVNIDGNVIPIGPDSKPLYPCPDLPKKPPLSLLGMMGSNENGNEKAECAIPKPSPPQPEVKKTVPTKTMETQTEDEVVIQPPVVDLNLLNLIQNPSEDVNKAELLNKYKKKAQEKSEDVLKCIEIEKNLGVNPSKGGVRRSIPMKLTQKKTSKDDASSSGSDMVLDSGDSDCASALKIVVEPDKGPVEEIILNSDDDNDILQINCEKLSKERIFGCKKSRLNKYKKSLRNVSDKEVPKETSSECNFEDYITEKIQRALKLLSEKNHVPPTVGRFIISDVDLLPSVYNLPNESPLLRNRIQFSFLTPNPIINEQPITIDEPEVKFKFLPQKKDVQKREKNPVVKQKPANLTPIPVFTFDFAMQCDFTSEIIRNLNLKISRLEMEISRLKRVNSNLFDDFRHVQTDKQKKAEELRKALLEIQDKKNEIRSLKRSRETSK